MPFSTVKEEKLEESPATVNAVRSATPSVSEDTATKIFDAELVLGIKSSML